MKMKTSANALSYRTQPITIIQLIHLFENGNLNLEPGFQRQSVWAERDRAKLIESILRNYPLPAIFLYQRHEAGHLIYDVIDGKQRLESIFMFVGAMRGKFAARAPLTEGGIEWLTWNDLKRRRCQHVLESYVIPMIEVDGELGDIIEVFVRINSTGKALTRQEKRNARYYSSPFLKEAHRQARRFEPTLLYHRVFSAGQITRMKHIELFCELMLSLDKGDVLNKKTALDSVMAKSDMTSREVLRGSRLAHSAICRVLKIFSHLRTTRFRQITDFYTLVVLIGKFEAEGLILTDKRRNRLAEDLLQSFSVQVDEVRELQRRAKGAKHGQEIFRDYLLTVSQMTDDVSQRRKREAILSHILRSLFEKKDAQRGFTPEQRRLIWNSTANRVCSECGCKLTWEDFTIDHINPHSKGGRSDLANAALMCRSHNSSKGNRRKGPRKSR